MLVYLVLLVVKHAPQLTLTHVLFVKLILAPVLLIRQIMFGMALVQQHVSLRQNVKLADT